MKDRKKILVVAEDDLDDSLSLCAQASRLDCDMETCVILLAGGNTDRFLKTGIQHFFMAGAERIWAFDLSELPADDSAIACALAAFARQLPAEIILFNATIRGRAIAPALAAELKTGLTADCCALSIEDDSLLVQIRPAYGSQLNAEIVCEKARPQMASVRPGIFPPAMLNGIFPHETCLGKSNHDKSYHYKANHSNIEYIPFKESCRVKRESFRPFTGAGYLRNANIVIAGGRGIGSREGFARLGEIAAETGAALAASRGAVDQGFAPYSCQVGQTGVVVRPKLYVACGISGSVQHLAGISGAEKIVAINSDPKAPLFRYADFGIIGDWREVLETFLGKYKFLQMEAGGL